MSLPTLPTLLQTPIQTLLPPPPQKPNPTLAMQILNATAKYTTPTLEIYKAAQHAIQHLYKQIGTNTQIEKLQIVKAHVNLCARMVEDGMVKYSGERGGERRERAEEDTDGEEERNLVL